MFHSGYFQRVYLMFAITEHIHSCHISVSLSSRRMKAYSSPERNYQRKKERESHQQTFSLGNRFNKEPENTVLYNVITDTNYYKKPGQTEVKNTTLFSQCQRRQPYYQKQASFEKILSTPSFGGEVKPSVPCRRFAACKGSQELCGSQILDKICRNISRP